MTLDTMIYESAAQPRVQAIMPLHTVFPVKCCIGFMFQHDFDWVEKHLPKWMSSDGSWGLVALSGHAEATKEDAWLRRHGVAVGHRAFDFDFSAQANALLRLAASKGYKYMLRLDPDETMFKEDIQIVFDLLAEGYDCISLSRYNFEVNDFHVSPVLYPDIQRRGFEISKVQYVNRVHESVVGYHNLLDARTIHIYHYEGLIDRKNRLLKSINYERIRKNMTVLDILPEEYKDIQPGYRFNIPFRGEQP